MRSSILKGGVECTAFYKCLHRKKSNDVRSEDLVGKLFCKHPLTTTTVICISASFYWKTILRVFLNVKKKKYAKLQIKKILIETLIHSHLVNFAFRAMVKRTALT